MPLRIPVQSVVVGRKVEGKDGKQRIRPKVGEPFNFTKAEIEDLALRAPGALKRVVARDEDEDPAEAAEVETTLDVEVETVVEQPAETAAEKKARLAREKAGDDGGL